MNKYFDPFEASPFPVHTNVRKKKPTKSDRALLAKKHHGKGMPAIREKMRQQEKITNPNLVVKK